MATAFALGLIASYYYATNLTVVNGVGTTFDLTNVVIDTTRSLLYLQNCGHDAGCISTGGTQGRCAVGWKQKATDDYVNVGVTDCISIFDNISISSTTSGAAAATMYTENGVKVANMTTLDVTPPGALSHSTVSSYDVDGLLGLAYPLNYETSMASRVNSFLSDAILPWLPVSDGADLFSLNLNAEGEESTMLVGSYDEATYADSLQWSLTQAGPDTPVYHVFTIFDLQICQANTFGTTSSNWLAVVDTMSPCLTVPGNVFDSLRAWALNATSYCHMDLSKHFLCSVPSDIDPTSLPPLTFRLNHSSALLTLPLSDLLLDDVDGNGRRPLCIVRGPALSKDVHEYQSNPVVFGTLALRSLYLVVDLLGTRVGMANKPATSTKWSSSSSSSSSSAVTTGCAAPPMCVGQQQYIHQLNMCAPPACNRYLYQEKDPSDTHCRFSTKIQVMTTLVAVTMVAAELLSHMWRWTAGRAKRSGGSGGSGEETEGGRNRGPGPSLVTYLCTGLLAGVTRRRARRRRTSSGGIGTEMR